MTRNVLRLESLSTPRRFVVGLFVCAAFALACHKQPPVTAASPPSAPPTSAPSAPPAAAPPSPQVSRPVAPTPKPPPRPAAAIVDGPSLIRAMHARYASTWYHTIAFRQKTTVVLPGGAELVQTWFEAGALPGRLRIDTDIANQGGVLFARDSIYRFAAGKMVSADSGLNEALILGFDVYSQPPERTNDVLQRLGFDTSRLYDTTWANRPVYVVGANRGDTVSKQFWVDRDRLLFVRLLEATRQGRGDTRFEDYVQTNGGWVAKRVEQITNGKRRVLEEYADVRTNVAFPGGLFDPKQWSSTEHWVKP